MKGQQFKRMGTIAKILFEEGLGAAAVKLGWSQESEVSEAAAEGKEGGEGSTANPYAVRLRRVLERLGPLFVKFGQILSTREDLLPKEYCEEFSRLQSSVPPFDSAFAREIVEVELGQPIEQLFDAFEAEPMAAASLAQVHGARLKSGQDVVLKIQRPEASAQVLGDTEMLLWVSRQLDRFLPPYKARRIHMMAEAFASASLAELNFLHEAKIAERFRKNFENRPEIYVPQMYPELSTSKVLVMERIFGHKLNSFEKAEDIEAIGVSVQSLVERMFRAIMTQAYVHGLIHADLHPGNVFLLPDGRIAMIDFGLYGELSRTMQNALFRTVLYRTHFKHAELGEAILELMEATDDADVQGFKRAIMENNKRLEGASIHEFSVAKSIQTEAEIASKFGFAAPNELMMLARALVTVEGIAIKFAPDIRVAEVLRPIMREITLERFDIEKIMRDGLLVLPDILEMIELAPAFHRNVLKIERAFARSANLSEFVASQLLPAERSSRREGRSIGPFFLATSLWIMGYVFVLGQQNPIKTFGDLSLMSSFTLIAALVMTLLAFQRRS